MTGDQELGITASKEHATGEWYAEVVQKAELASYAPEGMSGFIITRPRGYALWEQIQADLDRRFKRTGVQNTYFPLLIPESYLEREKEIVEGFDPEVAWVETAGTQPLEERLAVRPTSESIIAPYLARWVRSHRDLPIRINQWASVVRWEATETKPFFRTKEFLWQEGHTAHADAADAWAETLQRLDQYEAVYEEVLAIPTLRGAKPEHDKFPGAETTTTVEALMPDGKSVQGATSHDLGTGFAEAFGIYYTDAEEDEQVAHTTSWGLSWRAVGAVIMTHSDDQGLVVPPAVAPEQVVIVPIYNDETRAAVSEAAETVATRLQAAGVRVHLDDRDERNPGFKFNEWELKGVPLRLELGPQEVDAGTVTAVRRPDGHREELAIASIESDVSAALEGVHETLLAAAEARLEENIREADDRETILGTIGRHGGYVRTPWCGAVACETAIKDEIAASIVAVPLEDDPITDGDRCGVCGAAAAQTAYFARTY
ncbi:MAG: proline--tRNA ligase [Haloquadratum sp.]|jgi:prolyl-tRNA synthetase|nr:proline--tRNA ligase [Haloferacaceae archaeon]MDR9445199.1 proline--tRNA ligase [Haloquadratum sp.]